MSLVIPPLHGLSFGGNGVPTPPAPGPTPMFRMAMNLSGAENQFPQWPSLENMAWWAARGVKRFRLPVKWENVQPTLGGPLDTSTNYTGPNASGVSYMACISQCIANAASLGATVMPDVHNSGRYNGLRVGESGGPTVAQFVNLWTRLSTYFRADPNFAAIHAYDLQNEWNNMDPASSADSTDYSKALIANCNQSVITALRGVGDNTLLHIEGDHYSGAWDWVSNNGAWAAALTDSANNLLFHIHCYLDSDSSGGNFAWAVETAKPGYAPPGLAVNANIGPQRMAAVVAWAAANGKILALGECGWGTDSPQTNNPAGLDDSASWNAAGAAMLAFCQAHAIEAYYWGGGPGFPPSYGYSPEPRSLVPLTDVKDFTATGLQGTQLTVIEQFSGFTGAQPTSYRIDLPFANGRPTLYGTPGQAMGSATPGFPFRIKYSGVLTGTATITPFAVMADGVTAAPGTFSPASVTLSAGTNPIATFTFTPGSAATMQIGATNNRGWSDPPLQAISSINDIYAQLGNDVAGPILALRREYTPYVGPALRLQRASDAAQQDFYFNNIGNLPRQAIQDWAGSRSVAVVTHYDQSNTSKHAVKPAGRTSPLLLLQNALGYPEIIFTDANGLTFPFDAKGAPAFTAMARANPKGFDQFARQDYYAGPFAFNLQQLQIIDPRDVPSHVPPGIGTGYTKTVALTSPPTNAWHSYAGTWLGNLVNGQKVFLDGVVGAQADTAGAYTALHTTFDYGNDLNTTFGWFVNYGPSSYRGSFQSIRMWRTAARTASEQANIIAADNAYYSTALPDSLSAVNPTISGLGNSTVLATKTSKPFAAATITDDNTSPTPTDSASITLSGSGGGTLSGTGLSGTGPYTIAATSAAALTTTLRAIVYTPSGAAGTSAALTLTVTSSAGTSASAAPVASVIAPAAAETPYAAPTGTFAPVGWKGTNLAGADNAYPSGSQYNYIYPQNQELDYYASKGFGIIRMPLQIRRIQPASYGALDPVGRTDEPAVSGSTAGTQTNLAEMKRVLDYAFTLGLRVIIDPHGFGGIYDTLNSVNRTCGVDSEADAQLADWHTRVATKFKNYPNVVFSLMNEPVGTGMTVANWKSCAVTSINAIAAVTIARMVLIPGGTNYTGAHDWVSSGNAAAWAGYVPPTGLPIAFEMHQYLDSNDSGTQSTVVAGKGATVLAAATSWLRMNGFVGLLGEVGWSFNDSQTSGGVPSTEGSAIMSYMKTNADAWLGWTYWLGGSSAFYGSYLYNTVPAGYPSGPFTDKPQMSILVANL